MTPQVGVVILLVKGAASVGMAHSQVRNISIVKGATTIGHATFAAP